MNNEKPDKDFEVDWIYAQYEDGKAVSDIAKTLGKSESYVYAKMKQKPEKYEDVKQIREEKHNRRLRRIRGLADRHIEEFLEGLDKQKASERIETVNRIAKDYATRVQLVEGKATENIGVGGMNKPFEVIITKTYEVAKMPDDPSSSSKQDENE